MPRKTFFVAGTDTDVGKTYASCMLLQAAQERSMSTLALKPVAAGCYKKRVSEGGKDVDRLVNDDALRLMSYSSVKLGYLQVNPVSLQAAASPHIAADIDKKRVSANQIVGFCRGALLNAAQFNLIEGAGGWRVPINQHELMSDIAIELNVPVIMVVRLKLGCLNHALLTAEAIRRDGLRLAGWIANECDEEVMPYLEENLATLSAKLHAPCVAHLRYDQNCDPSKHDVWLDRLLA